MKQQQKFSLSYYLLVFLSIVLMESIFFSGTAVKEISYSQFRNLLTDNQIKSIIIESDRLYGLEKAQALDENHSDKNSPIFQPPVKRPPGISTSV